MFHFKRKCFICENRDKNLHVFVKSYPHSDEYVDYHLDCLNDITCSPSKNYLKNKQALEILDFWEEQKKDDEKTRLKLLEHCKKSKE